MRVTISVICFLAIAISTGEGTAVLSVGSYRNDAHPNKCVFDENTIIDNGNSITRYCQRDKCIDGAFIIADRVVGSPDHCQKIKCIDGIGRIDGCPNIVLPQGSPCTLGEAKYPNASFPDCCNTVVHCPDGDREGTAVLSVGNYRNYDHYNKCVFDKNTIIDNFNSITRYCQRDKCIDGQIVVWGRDEGSPDHCQKIECLSGGVGHIYGCPNIVLPQGSACTLGEAKYPNASFPDCCNTVVHCPDGDRESFHLRNY